MLLQSVERTYLADLNLKAAAGKWRAGLPKTAAAKSSAFLQPRVRQTFFSSGVYTVVSDLCMFGARAAANKAVVASAKVLLFAYRLNYKSKCFFT